MSFFDINHILFTVWGYPVSYVEFFAIISGAIAVWLSAKGNIWSWPIGLINVALLFFLFFQVQLYPDMFLQIFFFITNLIGWWRWANPLSGEADKKAELRVSYMPPRQLILFSSIAFIGTFIFGNFATHLHEFLPNIFSIPSAFPYVDSFVTVMSVLATYLMVQKKVECWAVWLVVDVIATGMYFLKEIKFLGAEYFVFCIIAAFGLWNWIKEYRSYSTQTN